MTLILVLLSAAVTGFVLAGLFFLFRRLGGLERRIEALTTAGQAADGGEGAELLEARKKAIEAERKFTEGVANILNYSSGKKDER